MRINGIKNPETWKLMKKAGFRFILFGLESANQETLDRVNKNLRVEEIEPGLKMCKDAGLEPHITAMIGYPWETKEDAQRTLELKVKNAIEDVESKINSIERTVNYVKNELAIAKAYNKFPFLNSLGEFQSSAVRADVAISRLATLVELLDNDRIGGGIVTRLLESIEE